MKHRVWVIAGNEHQYHDYVRNKPLNGDKKYSYVYAPDTLRGFTNPHGVFIGTWRERPDILDILQQLIISTTENTDKLQNLRVEISKSKRRPLLVHVNGVLQQENTDYTVAPDHIAFSDTPPANSQISVKTLTDTDVYLGDGTTFKFYLKTHYKIEPFKQAADLLAKAIDQEILDQLIGKKPTVFDVMEEYDQPMTWKGFVK